MKKILPAALAALVLLSSCAPKPDPGQDDVLHIIATTYPVYLFTTAVTGQTEGVEVELLVNAQTACLHDYTLTVDNMKAIEGADVIVMNGAGLEDFMADALAASDASVIDCSEGMALLLAQEHAGHDGHEHEEEYDPHYWLDPALACQAVDTIAETLSALDPDRAEAYRANAQAELKYMDPDGLGDPRQGLCALAIGCPSLSGTISNPGFITFHDGFQYFAQAFGLELLKAIEEEEGATASAADIKEISALVVEREVPAIFVERNSSWATAQAISREVTAATGNSFTVAQLDLFMSGTALKERRGLEAYTDLMRQNIRAVAEALQ